MLTYRYQSFSIISRQGVRLIPLLPMASYIIIPYVGSLITIAIWSKSEDVRKRWTLHDRLLPWNSKISPVSHSFTNYLYSLNRFLINYLLLFQNLEFRSVTLLKTSYQNCSIQLSQVFRSKHWTYSSAIPLLTRISNNLARIERSHQLSN